MKTFLVQTTDIPEVQRLAKMNNCDITIADAPYGAFMPPGHLPLKGMSMAQTRELAKEMAGQHQHITISANQPEGLPRVLGVWFEGTIESFAPEFTFTKDLVDSIHGQRCDHCNVAHNRRKLFVVDDQGETLVVGGGCAKQLNCETRIKSLMRTVKKLYKLVNKYDITFERGDDAYFINLEHAFKLAYAVIKDDKYVSKGNASMMTPSTAGVVKGVYYEFTEDDAEYGEKLMSQFPDFSVKDKAREILDADVAKRGWSEFSNNCNVCLDTYKPQFGIIAYMASTVVREEVKAKKAELIDDKEVLAPLDMAPSKTTNIPGKFMALKVVSFDTDYGTRYFVKAVNENREGIMFYAGYNQLSYADDSFLKFGDVFEVRGQVKGLNRDGDLLELKRIKFLSVVPAGEAVFNQIDLPTNRMGALEIA